MNTLDLCYDNINICRGMIFDKEKRIQTEKLMEGIDEYDDEFGHHMIIPVADNINIKKIFLSAPDYAHEYEIYWDCKTDGQPFEQLMQLMEE